MPLAWIEYKGKRILYCDYRGMSEDDMIQQLEQGVAFARAEIGKCRILTNVEGARIGQRFMSAAKERAKEIERVAERQAIVGVDGLRAIMLKGYNAVIGGALKPFDTEMLAKEYLAK